MIRQLWRISLRLLFAVFSLLLVYGLAAWILGQISTQASSQFTQDKESCHDVYVVSNGVHLNILLPMKSDAMDWPALLPQSLADSQASFVQIGWGSRAFYTQVPTWQDLTVSIAAQALFYDDAVLFVSPTHAPQPNAQYVRHLTMCQEELKHVSEDIAKQFMATAPIAHHPNYYPAHGHYTPIMTCNEWMRLRLQHRSMPKWSPFDWAILNHLPL